MHTVQFSGIDHRSQSSISFRAPSGAKTADHFAMDDGRTQGPFGDIVGRVDIRAVKKNKQAVPMFEIAALQRCALDLAEGGVGAAGRSNCSIRAT